MQKKNSFYLGEDKGKSRKYACFRAVTSIFTASYRIYNIYMEVVLIP